MSEYGFEDYSPDIQSRINYAVDAEQNRSNAVVENAVRNVERQHSMRSLKRSFNPLDHYKVQFVKKSNARYKQDRAFLDDNRHHGGYEPWFDEGLRNYYVARNRSKKPCKYDFFTDWKREVVKDKVADRWETERRLRNYYPRRPPRNIYEELEQNRANYVPIRLTWQQRADRRMR